MQYLVTATALKTTESGSSVTVEIPRFILDSEIEDVTDDVTEENVFDKARKVMGKPECVQVMIQEYHPRRS
jgi:hypothetical protein